MPPWPGAPPPDPQMLLVKVSLTLSIVLIFKMETNKRHQIQKFQLQRPSNKKKLHYARLSWQYINLRGKDSIFSLTNHRAIVWLADQSQRYCVAVLPSVVTKFGQHFRHSQKVQSSPQRQWPTQYAHTGDFTMGAAHSRPPAYYTGLTPGINNYSTVKPVILQFLIFAVGCI